MEIAITLSVALSGVYDLTTAFTVILISLLARVHSCPAFWDWVADVCNRWGGDSAD